MMRMLWLVILVSFASGQIAHENTEDTTLNTTTLYPINKTVDIFTNYKNHAGNKEDKIKTFITKNSNTEENSNEHDKVEVTTANKERVTTWTVDASYAQPKEKQTKEIYAKPEDKSLKIISRTKHKENPTNCSQTIHEESEDSKGTDSKEIVLVETPKGNSEEKKFKPSPHLGSFFDEENLNLLKFTTPGQSLYAGKKPAVDFLHSKDFYMLNYKSPENTYRDQPEAPYRFESSHFPNNNNNWKQTLDSKPTVETSVKIPAGGLYGYPNLFKEKPNVDADVNDYGLSFHEDDKDHHNQAPVKKRSNPWKHLMQVITAFLPVGLIISALTPSVITLQSTNNDPYLVRSRVSRHAVTSGDTLAVPAISEPCRRRLLCEIHAEENYLRSAVTSRQARKHCYKLQCEDPGSLRRVLRWLLAHRPPHPPPPPPRHTHVVNYPHRTDDYP